MKRLLIFIAAFLVSTQCWAATYYISSSTGNDGNNGTAKGTPWAHLPGMVTHPSHTPVASDTFILMGCDIWPNADFPVTWTWSGSAGNVITIGVDQTWYNTTNCPSAWNRPVFDAENNHISGSYNQFWRMISQAYITIDNIEMKNFHVESGAHGWATCNYIDGRATDYLTLDHLYLHRWTHHADAEDFSCIVVLGDNTTPPYMQHSVFRNGIIENSDGDNDSFGGFYNWTNIEYSIIHDIVTAAILNIATGKVVRGNLVYNIVASYEGMLSHANAFETVGPVAGPGGSLYFYNNVIHDMALGESLMIGNTGETDYVWNNVIYNLNSSGAHTPEFPQNAGMSGMSVYAWNNTIVPYAGSFCFSADSYGGSFDVVTIQNNHCITTGVVFSEDGGTITLRTVDHNLLQTPAQATAQGYTSAETYAYSPTDVTDSTVAYGVDLTAKCSGNLAPLCIDTSYAVSLGPGNTVIIPARTSVARPNGAAWDAGAYEYPTGDPQVTLSANYISLGGLVGSTGAVTLTNTGDSTLTFTSITMSGSDYTVSYDCGATLAAAASCTITATLRHKGPSLSGTISIVSDAPSTPDTVAVSGAGTAYAARGTASMRGTGTIR